MLELPNGFFGDGRVGREPTALETELLILWMYRILPGHFLAPENEFQI